MTWTQCSLGLQEQDKKDILAVLEEYRKAAARCLDFERDLARTCVGFITARNQLSEATSRVMSVIPKPRYVFDREYLTADYTCNWLTTIPAAYQAIYDTSPGFQRVSSSPSPSCTSSSRVESATPKLRFVFDREYLTAGYTCNWLTTIPAAYQAIYDTSSGFQRVSSSPSPSSTSPPSSRASSSSPPTSPSILASPCTHSPQHVL